VKRLVATLFVIAAGPLAAYEYADFTPDQQRMMLSGQTLVWTFEDSVTHRQFTCVAAVMDSPLPDVWAFIGNKELAPSYLNGVDISKVVGREGDDLLVYQQTRPTGIAKSFKYVTKHHPIPYKRIQFERVSGDLRNIEGAWHFDAVEEGRKTLLVYQLHIDPGFLYPQAFVMNNQKQRLPQVMMEVRKRLAELRESQGSPGGSDVPKLVNSDPSR
jgi:hypothetical protein